MKHQPINYLHYSIPTNGYQEFLNSNKNGFSSRIFWFAPIFPIWWLYHKMFAELFIYLLYLVVIFQTTYFLMTVNLVAATLFFILSSFLPTLFMFLVGWQIYYNKCERVMGQFHYRNIALNMITPLNPLDFFVLSGIVFILPCILVLNAL